MFDKFVKVELQTLLNTTNASHLLTNRFHKSKFDRFIIVVVTSSSLLLSFSSSLLPPSSLTSSSRNVLRQVLNLHQSEFAAQCDLVLPFSISSMFSFPWSHPASVYVFFLVFPSPLSSSVKYFIRHFVRKCFLISPPKLNLNKTFPHVKLQFQN
jgi:hypothetical protein